MLEDDGANLNEQCIVGFIFCHGNKDLALVGAASYRPHHHHHQ